MRTSILLRSSAIAIFLGLSALSAQPAAAQTAACEPVVAVNVPPPPLPVYEQPPVPAPGYIWSPGYWSWEADEGDYYWVPGAWTLPPRPGLLWTPGYWAWVGGAFLFHRGYWGPNVGFYGGVHYGYGYTGDGYEGGRWDNGVFSYNRAVNNLTGARVTNVYNKTVVVNNTVNNVSYNGGRNGVVARPTPQQKTFAKEAHFAPTSLQQRHVEAASKDPALFDKANHGKPSIAATPRAAEFKGPGVAPARMPETGEARPMNAPAKGVAAGGNKAAPGEQPVVEKKPVGQNAAKQQKTFAEPATRLPRTEMTKPQPAMQMEKPQAHEPRPQQPAAAMMRREPPRPEMAKPQPAMQVEKPQARAPRPQQPAAAMMRREPPRPAAHEPAKRDKKPEDK